MKSWKTIVLCAGAGAMLAASLSLTGCAKKNAASPEGAGKATFVTGGTGAPPKAPGKATTPETKSTGAGEATETK